MRNLSDAFLTSEERYQARLQLPDGTDVTGDIVKLSVTTSLNGSGEELTLGASAAAAMTCTVDNPGTVLRDTKVQLLIGRTAGGVLEEIPFGVYTITGTKDNEGAVEITGYDAMATEMEVGYFPSGSPGTAKAVLSDLCAQAGVELVVPSDLADVPVSVTGGCTRREMIGYMAALLGCSACMDDQGRLALRWFTPSGLTVDGDMIYAGGLELADSDFTLGKISCSVTTSTTTKETDEDGYTTTGSTENTQTLTAGDGVSGLSLSNPWMTQSVLDGIFLRIGGMVYRGGTVSLFGDLRHEVGDMITVVDYSGVSHTVPVMQITQEYDGGFKTAVSAYAKSETESSANASGPLTQAVERYAAELALFKNVIADNLTATNAKIGNLRAENAEIKSAVIQKADIADLNVVNAEIEQLKATDAEIQTAVIGKADITDLNVVSADVDALTADVANINNVLAGNVGTGNLQAVHLTSDNAVIDEAVITDAMIANLSVSKLTAGTIYTSLIKIASDEDENLLIDGSTIQIKDSNAIVRVQIGKDALGDYNYYLWDAAGNLLWNPTGVTEAGLNAGIIKDVAVAEDANISGSKLNIASVAERLNEDGSITVDASRVQIDDTTLDVAYQSMTTKTEEVVGAIDALQSDSVADITPYYAVGTSSTEPPDGTASVPLLTADGESLLTADGEEIMAAAVNAGEWTTEQPTAGPGEYLWVSYLVEYLDGSVKWTTPTLATDATVRETTTTLQTELEVVQGQITSKVWQTDITQAVEGIQVGGRNLVLGTKDWADSAFYINGIYGPANGTIADGILTVPLNNSAIDTHYVGVEAGEEYTVSVDIKSTVAYNGNTILLQFYDEEEARQSYTWVVADAASDWARISQTFIIPDGIHQMRIGLRSSAGYINSYRLLKLEKGNTPTDWTPAPEDTEAQITTLTDQYTTVTQTVSGIQTEIGSLQTTVGENYSELDSRLTTLSLTADGLSSDVSAVQTSVQTAQSAADAAKTDAANAQSAANAASSAAANAQSAADTAQTTANEAKADVAAAEQRITTAYESSVSQTASEIRAEVSAVESKVDNLEIGSRNYIRNSKTLTYDSYSFVSRGSDTAAYVGSAVVGTSTADGVVITAAQLNAIETNNANAATAIASVKTTMGVS